MKNLPRYILNETLDIPCSFTGAIDHAAVISGAYLIVCGWLQHPGSAAHPRYLEVAGLRHELGDAEVIRSERSDLRSGLPHYVRGQWGFCLVWKVPDSVRIASISAVIFVTEKGTWRAPLQVISPSTVEGITPHLMTWPHEQRDQVLDLLRALKPPPRLDDTSAYEPLEHLSGFVRAHVEHALAVPGEGVFLYGWLVDPANAIRTMHVVQENTLSDDLLKTRASWMRADLISHFAGLLPPDYSGGFFALVRLKDYNPARPSRLVVAHKSGRLGALDFDVQVTRNALSATEHLLANLDVNSPHTFEHLDQHVGPAMDGVWSNRLAEVKNPIVHTYGTPPQYPTATVIIPIYGRCDFVRYQMSQFAGDADFQALDLIYVLDDPRIRADFDRTCADTFATFRLPFRTLDACVNLGYAGANNLGARYAAGPHLLLLNSDVLPIRPGWVGRMRDAYLTQPRCGALGLRMLFDDGTLQHDGMTFTRRDDVAGFWLNDHPAKGIPPQLAQGPEIERVPAVTGACMMVDRELFQRVGGLDEGYILGDFEDSDLCLRLRSEGYEIYVSRVDAAYHLERLSQCHFENPDWKHKITLYNAWRHTRRWDGLIHELLAETGDTQAGKEVLQ